MNNTALKNQYQQAIQTGDRFLSAGELVKAEQAYKEALQIAPQIDVAFFGLHLVAFRAGNLPAASDMIEHAIKRAPANSRYYHQKGEVLLMQEQFDAAIAAFKNAVSLNKMEDRSWYMLGYAQFKLGKLGDAITNLEKSVRLNSKAADVWRILGETYVRAMQKKKAEDAFDKMAKLAPDNLTFLGGVAATCRHFMHFELAVKYMEVARKAHPDNESVAITLANAYRDNDEGEKAKALLLELLEVYGPSAKILGSLGIICTYLGENDLAATYFHEAIELDPSEMILYNGIAVNRRYKPEDLDEIDKIASYVEKAGLNEDMLAFTSFPLAKMYDDAKAYDKAFHYINLGNTITQAQRPFSIEEHEVYIDRVIKFFDKDYFASRVGKKSNPDERPVFIVGMPRSGSTLVEQILSAHSKILSTEEVPFITHAINVAPQVILGKPVDNRNVDIREKQMAELKHEYPQILAQANDKHMSDLAEYYLREVELAAGGSAERITDKQLYNYMHLGFIATLFPNAKIIHCKRHPLDTCISCYFQNFAKANGYTYNLEKLGDYYLIYQRMMEHWKRELPLEIFDVEYADMVNDQEATSRAMIEHLGLDWEEGCLNYRKNDKVVKTASLWQVRQPIYKRSVERWRNYDKYIGVLKDKLGYSDA